VYDMQERVTMRENRPWDRGLGVLLDEQASKYKKRRRLSI